MEAHPNTNMTITETTENPATKPLLEVWGRNEVMRHVPSLEWLTSKLDGDVRRRVEKLYVSIASMNHDDPRRPAVDDSARALCRALDRLAETARHTRTGHPPQDLGDRMAWSVNHAVSCLNSLDAALFGRRCPFHTFERSKSEPVYGATVAVLSHLRDLTNLVRTIDPDIDGRLLDNLVNLQTPLRRDAMA
jgi:hypothetical protein